MDEYGELLKKLELLKKNETQMSAGQREKYKEQLSKLRKRIQTLALTYGRSYLFSGIRTLGDEPYAAEHIRAVLSENEIGEAERAALTVLFSCYDFERYLRILTPLAKKIFYLGYGPYWVRHCKKVSDRDADAEFSHYNDLIDMFWVPAWREWKRKGRWEVTLMLPPTMKQIKDEYRKEISDVQGGEIGAGSEGVSGGTQRIDL